MKYYKVLGDIEILQCGQYWDQYLTDQQKVDFLNRQLNRRIQPDIHTGLEGLLAFQF